MKFNFISFSLLRFKNLLLEGNIMRMIFGKISRARDQFINSWIKSNCLTIEFASIILNTFRIFWAFHRPCFLNKIIWRKKKLSACPQRSVIIIECLKSEGLKVVTVCEELFMVSHVGWNVVDNFFGFEWNWALTDEWWVKLNWWRTYDDYLVFDILLIWLIRVK